jgi:hypothetical protein
MPWDGEQAYGWSFKHESDSNRMKGVERYRLTTSPVEADLWFKVSAERVTQGTEVRGRIVGPRLLFEQAAETESPFRSIRQKEGGQFTLIARTSFGQPSFWDPHNPFLYRVILELWQDGQRCDLAAFDMGFRKIELSLSNVCVNERPLFLRGMQALPQSREEAADRRQAGYNLLLASEGQWHWWVKANPMGFLLLERAPLSRLSPHYIGLLSHQPCSLGFVLGKELLNRSLSESESCLRPWKERHVFIGLELEEPPTQPLPDGLSFLVCLASSLPGLIAYPLPKLVLGETQAGGEDLPLQAMGGILG